MTSLVFRSRSTGGWRGVLLPAVGPALLVPFALLMAACSGTDDTASTTVAVTTPATASLAPTVAPDATVPGSAIAASEVEPLFPSLSGFVAAFTGVGRSGATQGAEPFALTVDSLTRGALSSGGEGFVTVDVIAGGILGGTLAADEAVTAVFVFLDPTTPAAAPALISLLGTTIASSATFDQAAFATQYRELAVDAANRIGEQTWTPSTNGSGHSLVTTVVEGVAGGNSLIEVAIVPVTDEVAAKAAVKPMRNEVIALALG